MNISISNILDQIISSVPLFKPELALIIGFVLSIFSSLFLHRIYKHCTYVATLLTLGIVGYLLFEQLGQVSIGFSNMWIVDPMSSYARIITIISAFVITLFIGSRHSDNNGDIYSVLLAAILGTHILASTSNWLLAFIGIEMVSIASYILVGYFSKNKGQAEASMKYALFGSVCAAVMLYGLSLIYGLTGNLDFQAAAHLQGLMAAPELMTSLALLFTLVGIGFKLGFVPFHVWTPDVYQGAPTSITAFLSTVPKVGALILFTRLYQSYSSTNFYFSELINWYVVLVAIATMLVGNLAALRQTDVKRMMAYSSIGHTGFLLMAIYAYQDSSAFLFFYICAYVLMNLAAFLFIDQLEYLTKSTLISSYGGLGKKMPVLFTAFSLVCISLIGLPPTIGFIGKLMVFTALFDFTGDYNNTAVILLLVVGALTSVISLFFYFRIPLYAFLRKEENISQEKTAPNMLLYISYLFTLLLILLGLFPSFLIDIFN
ncbi:NADH-quinone oxidoreductase subunit N [Sphingobacterium shayense]|uniref:NADH-quinone oxidoreductase subunit N n=1 Tax=Sphingobacterium shayense TaxID=626343 RepID=UPI001551BCFB|nr:NADH-quinone oxidoreductase subunit N [Sphingobacterium shayense]